MCGSCTCAPAAHATGQGARISVRACALARMAVASFNLKPVPASAFRSPSAAHSTAVLTRRRRRTMLGSPVRSYTQCAPPPGAPCVCAKKVARKQAPCSALHYKIMQRLRAKPPPLCRLCSATAHGSLQQAGTTGWAPQLARPRSLYPKRTETHTCSSEQGAAEQRVRNDTCPALSYSWPFSFCVAQTPPGYWPGLASTRWTKTRVPV